jgi:flagellar secretion chaperone FliS
MNYSTATLRTTESFNNNRANAYVTNEIMDASPQKLIMKIYDFAISQCKNENLEKTNKALAELINSLRFDSEEVSEISIGLKKLYEFCQDQMRKKNYDVVLQILTELRETWTNLFASMRS